MDRDINLPDGNCALAHGGNVKANIVITQRGCTQGRRYDIISVFDDAENLVFGSLGTWGVPPPAIRQRLPVFPPSAGVIRPF